jgi:hypothetical protein
MNEGGTRCTLLSVIVDGILPIGESVCRCDAGVGNGRNDEFVSVDQGYGFKSENN